MTILKVIKEVNKILKYKFKQRLSKKSLYYKFLNEARTSLESDKQRYIFLDYGNKK